MLKRKEKQQLALQNETEVTKWHGLTVEEVFEKIGTKPTGLSYEEVELRKERYGLNVIEMKDRFRILKMIWEQFSSFLVVLLIFAGLVSLIIGIQNTRKEGHIVEEIYDAIAIFAIIIINAIIGFVQDYRSNQALEKLKQYFDQEVVVLRNGKETFVSSKELVPGDILSFEMGDKIAADCRLIEVQQVKIDEAPLTGESTAVKKHIEPVSPEARIHDRKNMVYMGTTCVYGRGKGIVVATGMDSEMGKIAALTQTREEMTPLQKALDKLGKVLGLIIILLCLVLFLMDWLIEDLPILESFETSIALAISAVPEGLPAAIVITLAIGVARMAKRKAIVKKLPAVETLGSVDYICSDKTGTLTRNEMTVKEVYLYDKLIFVGGSGYLLEGDFTVEDGKFDPLSHPVMKLLIEAVYHCNNSSIVREKGNYTVRGDPTEAALVVLAEKAGFKEKRERIHEIFFDSERKRMTTVHKDGNKKIAYLKGSPPTVLNCCDYVQINDKIVPITTEIQHQIEKVNHQMSEKALRVLGVAYKIIESDPMPPDQEIEDKMIFLGLTGMIDPPREEVRQAIAECREAGITTVMITGDQKETAVAIAKSVGIINSEIDEQVITGEEFAVLSDDELEQKVEKIKVYSRMSPKDKYRVVATLQKLDHIVAVTGDGVNDAPALKKADIGVAMGITGTDVSKEVADMVITDDAFNTIVNAVEEGRNIFENMKRFIRYLLSCNFDEIFAVLLISLWLDTIPFLPLQILYLNLLTDALPALALSFEPYDPRLMKRKPRSKKSSFVRDMYVFAGLAGIVAFFASVGVFLLSYFWLGEIRGFTNREQIIAYSQMMAFVTTLTFELWFVFIARNDNDTPFLKSRPLKNKILIVSVLISWILLLLVIYIKPLLAIFSGFTIEDAYFLSAADWGIILAVTLGCQVFVEIARYLIRWVQTKRKMKLTAITT
ncbi:MAG: cation-translocating P-type ATPase [Candidatus Heimdallarchaeaceae archaeon]